MVNIHVVNKKICRVKVVEGHLLITGIHFYDELVGNKVSEFSCDSAMTVPDNSPKISANDKYFPGIEPNTPQLYAEQYSRLGVGGSVIDRQDTSCRAR